MRAIPRPVAPLADINWRNDSLFVTLSNFKEISGLLPNSASDSQLQEVFALGQILFPLSTPRMKGKEPGKSPKKAFRKLKLR